MTTLNGIPYGPPTPPGASAEGDGYLFTCTCSWVRWWPKRSDATTGRLAHQKKCKGSKSEGDE